MGPGDAEPGTSRQGHRADPHERERAGHFVKSWGLESDVGTKGLEGRGSYPGDVE